METSEASVGGCLPVRNPVFSDEVPASPLAVRVCTHMCGFISAGLTVTGIGVKA